MAVGSVMDLVTCVLLLLWHTCSSLKVTAPSPQVALLHSQAVLPCSFHINASPINPKFLAILWYFENKELLRFDNKEKVINQGLSFNDQEAEQGNASLTIHNVTISDQGTYKCLVIYSPERQEEKIQLNVHAKPEVRIVKKALRKDERNQLFCSISGFYPKEVRVTWLWNNIQVLNRSGLEEHKVNADGTYRVNSIVSLKPGQVQDRPSIVCQVDHVSLQKPIQDVFQVEYGVAPKVRLTSSRTPDGQELIYVCEARGFFPKPLSINWLVDGKTADLSGESVDGVFNKEIYYQVNLKDGKIPEQISCSVQHETLNSPVINTLKVNQYNECTRNCHSGLTAVMAVLLVVALLLILISSYLIIKENYTRRFQVSDIYEERTWANEELVNLYCMALKCPKGTQVVWTVSIKGQEPIMVSDGLKDEDEETGPLLHSDYHVKTVQRKRKELNNVTTKLFFNPAASEYKEMEVKCRFTCGGKVKERSLTLHVKHKKPEMKDSIKAFLNSSNDIVCCATLEDFYPRNIQIQWSYGADQYNNVNTTKEDIPNNTQNHTYKAISECNIPSSVLQNSRDVRKVRVTWTHPSMPQPESREIPLEDIAHRPVMEDIVIPSLLHGTEAKLQCEIRGFSPNNLQVNWLRREAGKTELYALHPSDKYKIPVIESTQQPDKTFTCTASLIVLLSALTDHGSEFICRVTHSSLETYLERRTGELLVKGIPEVEVKYLGKTLRAIISNFSPNNITVTWGRADIKSKIKYYDDKEIIVVKPCYDNGDGTFTSVMEVSVSKHKYKEYVITVEHETLRSPIVKTIIQTEDNFCDVEKRQEKKLQKCEDPSDGQGDKLGKQKKSGLKSWLPGTSKNK